MVDKINGKKIKTKSYPYSNCNYTDNVNCNHADIGCR